MTRMLKSTVAAALGAAILGGCSAALLDPRGPIGQAQKTILLDSLAIMLAIVVPTIIATLAVARWFRASNSRAHHRPDWEFSGQIELVVWAVPLMTIVLLGGVTWIGSHQLDPAKPLASQAQTVDVQVVSLDWKWLFIYPRSGVASVNELVIPAGVPVHFELTSASVMNAFFVPQLGSMIYTMNGMATQLNLQADEPGVFPGLSAQFSGDGFADMVFQTRALPANEFAGWLKAARAGSRRLDSAAYRDLAQQGTAGAPFTYAAVESDLFHRIVMQTLPPGPGPRAMQAGAIEAAPASQATGR